MLRHPGAVEALSLGVDDLLGNQPVTGFCIRLIQNPAEEAQSLR